MRMKISIPPPPPPGEDPFHRQRADERFEGAIWDLIVADSGAVDVDKMRTALEEVLLSYYDINGDGTAGSA